MLVSVSKKGVDCGWIVVSWWGHLGTDTYGHNNDIEGDATPCCTGGC